MWEGKCLGDGLGLGEFVGALEFTNKAVYDLFCVCGVVLLL